MELRVDDVLALSAWNRLGTKLGTLPRGLDPASATRLSNYASATTAQQPTTLSLQQLRFGNYASATKAHSRFSNQASTTKIFKVNAKSHLTRKSHPLWQVHAKSHLTRHIKIPPPLASTCAVTSYTSYLNVTPAGKYMHSHILHVISKSHPLWQVHAKSHLTHHIV